MTATSTTNCHLCRRKCKRDHNIISTSSKANHCELGLNSSPRQPIVVAKGLVAIVENKMADEPGDDPPGRKTTSTSIIPSDWDHAKTLMALSFRKDLKKPKLCALRWLFCLFILSIISNMNILIVSSASLFLFSHSEFFSCRHCWCCILSDLS